MLEKITELCKKRGKTFRQVEMDLGWGNGTLKKSSIDKISFARLHQLADYFEVPYSEITGKTTKATDVRSIVDAVYKVSANNLEPSECPFPISVEDMDLLIEYHNADEQTQAMIKRLLEYAKAVAKEQINHDK